MPDHREIAAGDKGAARPPERRPLTTLLAAAPLAAACAAGDTSLTGVQESGVLRVGYAVEAPYAFCNPDGTVTGEAPEIARVIAQRIDIGEIEWVQVPFEDLIPQLRSHRFDVIAAGMFPTEQRARLVRFSSPTFAVGPALLTRPADLGGVVACEDLAARPGLRIAVLAGAVEHDTLEACGVTEQQLVAVPDPATGRAAVASGTVDALALSAPSVRWLAARAAPELDAVLLRGAALPVGKGAFAFRLEDQALADAWEAALRGWVGSADHQALAARFGFSEAELPSRLAATR
jgi:polar amino acid transport system substrate-binding protein